MNLIRTRTCSLIMGGLFAASLAIASGRIDQFILAGNDAVVVFETTVGEFYQLQCREELNDGDWINIGLMFKATAALSARVVNSPGNQCYFRVVVRAEPTSPGEPPPVPN